ncbi:hypothetical protein NXX53_06780 [Bacteroides salyersiae]|nr:hypothetical protein [Bacteroides salyersiae]
MTRLIKKQPMIDKATNEQYSPLLRHFHETKQRYPDGVILYRCGNYYEMMQQDASTVSQLLGLPLSHFKNHYGDNIDAAGFPFRDLGDNIPKLIRAGHRVLIIEDVDNPEYTMNKIADGKLTVNKK